MEPQAGHMSMRSINVIPFFRVHRDHYSGQRHGLQVQDTRLVASCGGQFHVLGPVVQSQ